MSNRLTLACALLLLAAPAPAVERYYVLTAEQWTVPRRGETLRTMPALVSAMQELHLTDNARLVIRHPGGDAGTLWANELRGWLVSLGLASQRIELAPGSSRADAIELAVVAGAPAAQSDGPAARTDAAAVPATPHASVPSGASAGAP